MAPSIVKVACPVGVPAPGETAATVAVIDTVCPNTEALDDESTLVVVLAGATVWFGDSVPELLLKFVSPPYATVTVVVPTGSVDVEYAATPPFSATVTGAPAPIVKVTTPDGVPAPGDNAATVAVNVTAWPYTEELDDEATLVALSALLTTWFSADDVLMLKFASPL